jgi:metal-sulfur cluster biosynthetic enzyme
MRGPLPAAVADALAQVYDPCSMATGTPLNVIEMGLVRDVVVDGGHVSVTLCATTPSCVLIASIMQGVHDMLARAPEFDAVDVHLDAEAFWTPDLMTADAREGLQARRRALTERMRERRQAAAA